ncbi:DUF2284 domain-containing protein [Geoglobus acetivorans]|uniref:DUF2284 domain-containing protein n=1 Tax=Geoglobus acetivorans TaxID=565033 RepID=A0ABZ3H5K5_GEOAI|nr:DUF2284 domain-containing protein [Geoglobus acetivorans]
MDLVELIAEMAERKGIRVDSISEVEKIKTDSRTRWKCKFGCMYYGKRYSCPPEVPENFTEFIGSYRKAVAITYFFRDYMEDKRRMQELLPELESRLLERYPLAFALFPGGCDLCDECSYEKTGECVKKERVRPSVSSMGIIVSQFGIRIGDSRSVAVILLD